MYQGCDIIRSSVRRVTAGGTLTDGSKLYRVETDDGDQIVTTRVLIAAGAYSGLRNFYPSGIVPETRLTTEAVILAEVKEKDLEIFRCAVNSYLINW